ncbi:Gfo/Idh/MocA family oxidoreductase [Streptomyces sp. B6B3]|uniref:Gfo/Idh/MocA family oxidoreductase n=1 Tax=Streptomyces sp. B6B3 TaxID=3153570 RepID=UPI00325F981C
MLAGAGGYGRHHLVNLRRLAAAGRVRLVGVCEPGPLPDDALAGLGEPARSADLSELLNRTRPTVTIVSTPLHTHRDLALAAVRAGSHLLLEKPPTASLAGFRELAGALRESGLVCQVGFQSFGSRAVQVVRELLADGAVGTLHGIGAAGSWVRDARYYARSPWAGRRRLDAGPEGPDRVDVVDGVLTNPLAHAVATALRIDDSDRAEDVAALDLELFRANDIEADDTSCLRLLTTRGTPVTVAATLCAERNEKPYVAVHGERGRITLWYTEDRVRLERPGSAPEEHAHPRTDLLEDLLDRVRDGGAPLSPLARSGAFTRVVEAVRTAPDPIRLGPGAWREESDGVAPRRVIPGIGALIDASAASLSLFSELGAPWAGRRTPPRPRPSAGPRPRTLHLAGDSTAAGKPASVAPMAGWGMALPWFLAPGLAVANHARDGRSSRSFLLEGRLDPVLRALGPDDLLLIQFGHNDQKAEDPTRRTEPFGDYQRCLLRYVLAARERGACPVLLTPVERRGFDTAGNAVPTHGDYAAAVRDLAAAEAVPLVDVQAESLALWQRLGAEGSKEAFLWLDPGAYPGHPRGARDDTHLQPRGALLVARLVARGLRAAGLLDAEELRHLSDPLPTGRLTWPGAPTDEPARRA